MMSVPLAAFLVFAAMGLGVLLGLLWGHRPAEGQR